MKCIRSGLIAPGFSPNGLNFIWIVRYFLEMYFPDKTMPLTDGLPEIYRGPHGVMLIFNYDFWIIFIALVIFTLLIKHKTPIIILKICIIEYTFYFLFKLAVHENHLILGGIIVGIGNIGPGCFCLISGYFGIRFSKQKLIKMELMMIFYSLFETLLLYLFFPQEMYDTVLIEQLIKSLIPFISRKYWFYSCYICLFIFSDYIQKFLNNLTERDLRVFLIISLTIFSVFPTLFYFEIVQDSGKE